MTTQLSNFKQFNYSRALLYDDLKRNRYRIAAVTDMATVASAVLFPSEYKGSGF